ncbi:MAG: putative phosphoesterase [Arcticibacterium sp.]|jgi:putative phosphoesterase
MALIGLLTDTHGYLDPTILSHFQDCDQIWHLGDIGDQAILDTLQNLKPMRAVFGNIDSKEIQWRYKENEIIELEGLRFLLRHIAGKPPKYTKETERILKEEGIDVLICGHSHQKTVQKDRRTGMVFINPGAAGKQGFHKERFIMKMEVQNKKITNLETIRLGKR